MRYSCGSIKNDHNVSVCRHSYTLYHVLYSKRSLEPTTNFTIAGKTSSVMKFAEMMTGKSTDMLNTATVLSPGSPHGDLAQRKIDY
jgi:hypothetical protein